MSKSKKIKRFSAFRFIVSIALILVTLSMVLPLLMVLSTSFAPEAEVIKYGLRIVPTTGIALDSYKYIFQASSGFISSFWVSIFITAVGTAIGLVVTCLMAYPMSKYEMPGRKLFFMYCFFTMLFSGGLIPTFMVVRAVGLYNSIWALIIPSAMNVWYMILMTNFFASIPDSLEESATIDGATNLQILIKIMIPLSLPAIATISLFYAVMYWNSWFPAVIYLNDRSKYPMQTLLRELLYSSFGNLMEIDATNIVEPPGTSVRSAAIVVTTFPIICVYPFVQKYFVKGVMIGAVKG